MNKAKLVESLLYSVAFAAFAVTILSPSISRKSIPFIALAGGAGGIYGLLPDSLWLERKRSTISNRENDSISSTSLNFLSEHELLLPADAELFVSRDSRYVLYFANIHLYSADGEVFREVYELDYSSSGISHHFSFEDGSDECKRHDVYRQGDNYLLLDGDKIGREKFRHPGNSDVGPFVTIDCCDFVLDQAVMEDYGLTSEQVTANKDGNILRVDTGAGGGAALVINATEMFPAPCPHKVRYMALPAIREPLYLFQLQGEGTSYVYVSVNRYDCSYDSFKVYIGTALMRNITVRKVTRFRGETYISTDEGMIIVTDYSTWGSETLLPLEPRDFNISETEESVRISAKI